MTHTLESLAPGVFAWIAHAPSHRHTNSGVVIAEDGITIVDAGLTPALATPLAQELAALTPLPIRRLVLSGSHIDLVGGSTVFPLAAVYGSAQTSDHLDQPPNPQVWRQLHPAQGEDFDELITRPVTHTVAEPAHLCPASIAVPLSGTQFENLAVQVPGANTVFTGCVVSAGVVPLGFEADFAAWINSVEQLMGFGEIFVPAHGPIVGVEELSDFRNYLDACIAANGDASLLTSGPWDSWDRGEFHQVNVERAKMLASGDPSPPPSMLSLLGR